MFWNSNHCLKDFKLVLPLSNDTFRQNPCRSPLLLPFLSSLAFVCTQSSSSSFFHILVLTLFSGSAFRAQGRELDLLWASSPPWQLWARGGRDGPLISSPHRLLSTTGHLPWGCRRWGVSKKRQVRGTEDLLSLPFWPHKVTKSPGNHCQRTEERWLLTALLWKSWGTGANLSASVHTSHNL